MFYRELVEETASQVDADDMLVPVDAIARAAALGFNADTFTDDVLDEVEGPKVDEDDRQLQLL